MARILILEPDPVSAALLEDRLHVAGHRAILTDDAARALSAAVEDQADLLVLAMELPVVPGIEVLRQLRHHGETRSLPIVVLSASGDSGDRLAALRAGADEYLSRPFEIEELLLRIDRLLGRRGERPPMMQGDLASHPTWELLQYIQQAGKSGELVIHGSRGSGLLRAAGGQIVAGRWNDLRGREALLAILDVSEGSFRLTTGETTAGPSTPSPEFTLQEVLIEAAWLEDELEQRRPHLPATGSPLRLAAAGGAPPTIDPELSSLPVEPVLRHLREHPGARLYDLLDLQLAAPPKVRLAVAWLVEQGAVVAMVSADGGELMDTFEISSSVVLDLAVHNLLSAARGGSLDTTILSYLLLAEPEVEPRLVELVRGEPGLRHVRPLRKLVEQLGRRQGGSAEFITEYGTLCLHVALLTPEAKSRIESIVPVCAGVMVWLEGGEEMDLIRRVVSRVEAAAGSSGVLVAGSPAVRGKVAELTADTRHWQTAPHPPRSMIGILRLLHPRSLA